jgi:hypothetical protein
VITQQKNNSMNTKSVFTSKTAIVNLVIALSAFYPPVGAWVSANPDAVLQGIAVVNIILRFATKDKVSITGQ